MRPSAEQATAKFTAIDEQIAARLQAVSATMGQSSTCAATPGPGGAGERSRRRWSRGPRRVGPMAGTTRPEPHKLVAPRVGGLFDQFHNPVEEPIDAGGAAADPGMDMLLPRDFELVGQRHGGHNAAVADNVGAGEISGPILAQNARSSAISPGWPKRFRAPI